MLIAMRFVAFLDRTHDIFIKNVAQKNPYSRAKSSLHFYPHVLCLEWTVEGSEERACGVWYEGSGSSAASSPRGIFFPRLTRECALERLS